MWVDLSLFQFQYGAIGGPDIPLKRGPVIISIPVWCDWWRITIHFEFYQINFNSSMVRLVASSVSHLIADISHFNSSMVRLVEAKRYMDAAAEMHFNSSMVRLVELIWYNYRLFD